MKEIPPIIERMKVIDWFGQVGRKDPFPTTLRVEYVESWSDALRIQGLASTADAFGEGRGMLTRELGIRFKPLYRQWNRFAAEGRELLDAEILPNIDSILSSQTGIRHIEPELALAQLSVRWDLIHCIMEHVYSDVIPARFYGAVLAVYEAGYFPCNWNEVWPDGTIWVY